MEIFYQEIQEMKRGGLRTQFSRRKMDKIG